VPVHAAAASDELDQLRHAFRLSYGEYLEAGERSAQFLSELDARKQDAEDLQQLLALQAAESRAYARYSEARLAYVTAVFSNL
jgi:hypothetical protein